MPIVQVEMLKGRTLEQKRALAQKVTEAIVETANCPKEAVKIIIREMDFENFSQAGVLKCDE
ncbi:MULTISPECIES: 2-hydroxymuconate tautomerase [Sedimentibacter]|uniref:Tautomerase n=1 Tax=Sedimentibacter hydroxybenzoicus DSM 7310 TaxID=1123245 RepID=A0A974BH79_SEDHY|nr:MULTISPECIES: 2-hydroxymuconate tautomerase [Sedimentibacter]NYB73048.1 2-hydroxymuconate tautomerase family protein [Sedimentibacter hydroxybenzoicus DSM 7310]HCX61379.1 4-oxalocrotonate tautomerase [Clostridiales bacterium]